MVERREPPEEPVLGDDGHPVEPAEGADEPGEDAAAGRAPRPEEPAEGEPA
jgi:hypothetical protein